MHVAKLDGVVYSNLRRREVRNEGKRDESSVLRHSREWEHDERTRTINWDTGDLFVVPGVRIRDVARVRVKAEKGGAALYWVHDEPLMDYLGVTPNKRSNKFEPTLYKRDDMLAQVE